VKGNRPAHMS